MVVAAYNEKRYDLGEALARLCGQASRMEKAAAIADAPVDPAIYDRLREPRHVQELAQEHAPTPIDPRPNVRCTCTAVGSLDPSDHGGECQKFGRGWETLDVLQPAPATDEAPTLVTPSGRCVARVGPGGQECHGVVYWEEEIPGVMAAGWAHFDPGISGHNPVANRPNPMTR